MSQQRKLKLKSRTEFVRFLDSFSKVNDSFIAEVKLDSITAITTSPDNTLVVYGEHNSTSDYNTNLNIPDSKKLVRVLDTINSDSLEFTINSNNLEYKDSNVKFKYHLFEDGFLSKPALSIEKIKNFKFDITFNLTRPQLQSILKGSTFATDTNKLYLYTDNGSLMSELTDRVRHNTDSYSMALGPADFDLQPIAINFDNIRLLTLLDNTFEVNINTQFGVIVVTTSNTTTKLSYIISSLTQ